MNNFKVNLRSTRKNGFDKMWRETLQSSDPLKKRQKQGVVSTIEEEFKTFYCEIFDTVPCQIQSRFV